MTFFRFEDPWLLMLLLLLPFLAFLGRKNRDAVIQYSSIGGLKAVQPAQVNWKAVVPRALRFLALALLVLALARPQEGHKSTEILSVGVDIMLAIDTSGSMEALDFMKNKHRINRLEVVKDVVADFIEHRKNDRIGMVVFGKEAYTQCPLTLDHDIVLSFLNHLEIGIAGDSTAIGSAIGISVKRLKDLEAKSKVIILLTDGRNNAGSLTPIQSAKIAKTFQIKIYTIGVGTRGKAPFLVDSIFGKQYVYQDVEIDEKTLKEIAAMTGARYFRATDLESLKDIYKQIDRLEKSKAKIIDYSEYQERFHYFLIPGLALILLEIVAANTRLRRIP
ncbi:MAG: VWA domain-containing protein [Nitrospinaceae bacterium]